MKGWICLHRQIKDHWIWQDSEKLKAWLDLLMSAGHDDTKLLSKGELLNLKTGQFVTSIRKLQDSWGWSNKTVMRFLNMLEKDGMIVKESTTKGTAITIVNWAQYQVEGYSKYNTKYTTEYNTEYNTEYTLSTNNNNYNKGNNRAPEKSEEDDREEMIAILKEIYGEDA